METGRDCIRRRLLQIARVFWLGIEFNYQESVVSIERWESEQGGGVVAGGGDDGDGDGCVVVDTAAATAAALITAPQISGRVSRATQIVHAHKQGITCHTREHASSSSTFDEFTHQR